MSDLQALMPEGTQYLIEKIKAEKEDIFRFTTMPTASVSNLGQVVQYLGESTQTYTQGTSYKCVAKGTTPETYEWVAFGGVKDNRIGDEITNIKVRFNDGFRPYISADASTIIPAFADATLSEIKDITNAYYNGDLTLEEIQGAWSVGDYITIHMNAIEAGTLEAQAEQDIDLVILDFDHDTLDTAVGNITKSLITLGMKAPLSATGKLHTNMTDYDGWGISTRRTWCKNTFINAIPTQLKNSIKPVTRVYSHRDASNDTLTGETIFILNPKEISSNTSYGNIGIQYPYLNNPSQRPSAMWTTAISRGGGGQEYAVDYSNGGYTESWCTYDRSLVFAMCI